MPNHRCPACGGCGRVELRGVLLETLQILQEQGPLSAIQLYEILSPSGRSGRAQSTPTAINNRLEVLMEMGYITREEGSRRNRLYAFTEDTP